MKLLLLGMAKDGKSLTPMGDVEETSDVRDAAIHRISTYYYAVVEVFVIKCVQHRDAGPAKPTIDTVLADNEVKLIRKALAAHRTLPQETRG